MVIKYCGFRQYRIKLHGSGRVTTRNRIYLCRISVFKPVPMKIDDNNNGTDLTGLSMTDVENTNGEVLSDDQVSDESVTNNLGNNIHPHRNR